jgi:hypothetical protein
MFIIKNKYIIPKGYKAIALWPFVLYKGLYPTEQTLNHEKIHLRQQIELLLIVFYALYIIFLLYYGYRNNPFEREAYTNDHDKLYIKKRKIFNWVNFIKNEQ